LRASHCSTTGGADDANQADLILIDPEALSTHDSEAKTIFEYREAVAAE
jgi:hypothetical protein